MIKIKNINFSYNTNEQDEQLVLKNLSFDIPKNKHTCILGHNGSGKSTLAKLLIGLDFAQSGTIEVDGIVLNSSNVYEIRNKIGIVFQNPDNQFIGATVQDDIAFGLENHCIATKDMPKIINKYASKVGMLEYLEHEPSRLSGGQKQRVAIAGILAMNPDVMIFDEATSMLDPIGVNEVNNSMNNLSKENRTLVSITHDIEYAINADYIVVLEKGELVFSGLPKEVFKNTDKLVEIGLDIPFALKISQSLNKEGFNLPTILTLKELEDHLCQLK